MNTRKLRLVSFAVATVAAIAALAQPRRPPRRPVRPTAARDAGMPANLAPSTPELISVPVGDVDNMLRQMRVWLFAVPAGASGYGVSSGAGG
ncbi:MAG TPA: hypothetical protein VFV33_14055, partial [Gemmatimonadaceae bacterium]|nr:hypothetical protein [Gemmatimonadaceae bacterium]